jgi:hypothetical protein
MCKPSEPGAFLSDYWSQRCQHEDRCSLIWLRSFAEGCVTYVGERNGYHDSDFYADYYDKESETFKRCEYGTTRAWTYPNNAFVDATPEILNEAEKAQKAKMRRQLAMKRLANIKLYRKIADANNLAFGKVEEIFNSIGPDYRTGMVDLLTAGLRSDFRKSLKAQVIKWTEEAVHKYPCPLSRNQLKYILPRR